MRILIFNSYPSVERMVRSCTERSVKAIRYVN